MYTCSGCKLLFPREAFGNGKKKKALCKACTAIYNKEYRLKNPEKMKEKDIRNNTKKKNNPIAVQQARDRATAWRLANPERNKENQSAWREANKERSKEGIRMWRLANADRLKTYKCRQLSWMKEWRSRNTVKIHHYNVVRRKLFLERYPTWLSDEDNAVIRGFYAVAQMYNKEDLKTWEVDHVVPLRGKLVSGLHVPWNLQLLTKEDNRKKRNKFEVS